MALFLQPLRAWLCRYARSSAPRKTIRIQYRVQIGKRLAMIPEADRLVGGSLVSGVEARFATPLNHAPLNHREPTPCNSESDSGVRHGSVKRVAGAVGEGSVAIGSVHQYLAEPERATTGRHR